MNVWSRIRRRDPDGWPAGEGRIRRNLAVSQWSALVAGALGALSNVATGNLRSALVLALGVVVVVVSMWIRKRGQRQLSAIVFLGFLITVIHMLCVVGDGFLDNAIMLYPLAILVAALMLDPTLLVGTTAACVTSVAVLVIQRPTSRPEWAVIFDASMILIITAVAVYLLLVEVVRSAAEARARGQRLAEAYRDLDARNTELERFTYVVSHDLKSPLVTIRGFLDYVEQDARGGNFEQMTKDMGRIRLATERMGRLLDDLLELSRTGRIAREPEEMPLGEVVEEAKALVDGRLRSRGVRLEIDEVASRRIVCGDRVRLVELMQNLLDNAAKFSGLQEEPRIEIGLREDPSAEPVFTVSDNGVGIEAAHHDCVFDLFHKLDPSAEGSGLGLALVRRIVESHRGRIWVESEGRGQGATFCFTLPREAKLG